MTYPLTQTYHSTCMEHDGIASKARARAFSSVFKKSLRLVSFIFLAIVGILITSLVVTFPVWAVYTVSNTLFTALVLSTPFAMVIYSLVKGARNPSKRVLCIVVTIIVSSLLSLFLIAAMSEWIFVQILATVVCFLLYSFVHKPLKTN